jgi:hypothetical protein
MIGITNGVYMVTRLAPRNNRMGPYWTCLCSVCGSEREFSGNALRLRAYPVCTCEHRVFNPDAPASVYYVRIEGIPAYWKIGITQKPLAVRFGKDFHKITVLMEWEKKTGKEASDFEQGILDEYNPFRYRGTDPILATGGNTEIFTRDVLNWDDEIVSRQLMLV